MEKIKVNMNPNPLDVQTIHASQNDGEARQWEFELHNNGEVIDAGGITEQMVFKSYEGGTEQILPENGAVPVTAPFVGDIKYPDATRNDQEFLYRQSPTEEDGNAKIKNLYGNTFVWNQLIENGNFESTSGWSPNIQANTVTASSNELTVNINTLGNNVGVYSTRLLHNRIANHKYLFKLDVYVFHATTVRFGAENEIQRNITTGWNTVYGIVQSSITSKATVCYITATEALGFASGESFKIRNYQCFDLTQMGLDISSPSDFTSLFPLSYYAYNQGSLLSFNGNGIKTVGKNLLNLRATQTVSGITFTNDNGIITINGTATANAYFTTEIGLRRGSYFIGTFNDEISSNVHIAVQVKSGAYPLDAVMSIKNMVVSLNNDINKFIIYINSGTTLNNFVLKPMVSFESPEYFEPYTESSTELPISTYFPTGMKSAGSVYDELLPTKAITRLIKTTVDGTNTLANYYGTFQGHQLFYTDVFAQTYVDYSNMANLKSNHYLTTTNVTMGDGYIRYQALDNRANIGRIYWNDDRYTSADAMNNALQSDPLEIISLAQAPTETSFTTASLVTENAEIPLSNEDGVLIGKCTEELSAEPGFHDAKIKLSDSDGTCYSNKLQLHVERSPQ